MFHESLIQGLTKDMYGAQGLNMTGAPMGQGFGGSQDPFGLGGGFMQQLGMAVLGQMLQHILQGAGAQPEGQGFKGRGLDQLAQAMNVLGPKDGQAGLNGPGDQHCAPPPNCGCPSSPRYAMPEIKGGEKDGWLAPHGGYEKKEDGTIDITQGKHAGCQAKKLDNGKYLVSKDGQPQGVFNAPKGEDKIASPLTFDLNGDGKVSTTNIANGRHFDIDGDGTKDDTAWAGEGDGVLAFNGGRDGDGQAGTDGTELLGNNTVIDGKSDFANGFEALRALAEKHLEPGATDDNKLDQAELQALEQKAGLTMIVDGQSRSLSDLGITELSLGYEDIDPNAAQYADEHGNEHRQVGTGFKMNGEDRAVNDVWFKYE